MYQKKFHPAPFLELSQEASAKVVLKVDIPCFTKKKIRSVLLHTPAHGVRLQVHENTVAKKCFLHSLNLKCQKTMEKKYTIS